jgi:hypothetical protein
LRNFIGLREKSQLLVEEKFLRRDSFDLRAHMQKANAIWKEDEQSRGYYYQRWNQRQNQCLLLKSQVHEVSHDQSRFDDGQSHQEDEHNSDSQMEVSEKHLNARDGEQPAPDSER